MVPGSVHLVLDLDLWQLAARLDRSVLLGDPGGGKTTAATVLMHHFAGLTDGPVPFLVTLRDYAAADPPQRSVAGHIEHTLETFYQSPAPPGMVDLLLLTGRAVVIFDGLDELLDTARRADVTSRVERFCAEYPQAALLVTSRLVGYDQARLDDRQFTCYRLGAFGPDQVGTYARKWFAQDEGVRTDEAQSWAEAFLTESASIPDLRTNPLLLSLMCILYRGTGSLPRDRAGLYEKCAHLLFDKWDARRRIRRELRAGQLLEPALRYLAWWLFTRDNAQSAVTERELIAETAAFLLRRGYEPADSAREAAREFVEFYTGRMWVFTDVGTTAPGERQYAFTHRTFLEYFAAEQLAFDCDTPEKLARTLLPHVARREWGVVAELAVQIKDRVSTGGAERVYCALLGDRRYRSPQARCAVLEFLAQSLRSVDPSPQRVRELTRELVGHLLAGYPVGEGAGDLAIRDLFVDGDSHRDTIAAEADAVTAELIRSGGPEAVTAGLQFAISMSDVSFYPTGWDSRKQDFWRSREDANLQTWATVISVAAETDAYLRYRALRGGIITTRQALIMPGGLSSLFIASESFIGTTIWPPYLDPIFRAFLDGWPASSVAAFADDLVTIGEYLLAYKTPPWFTGTMGWWNDEFGEDYVRPPAGKPIKLGQAACLGAAAIAAIMAELGQLQLPRKSQRNLGQLRNLYPYLARRNGSRSGAGLPDLPVPDEFKPIFRDWAAGRINLTA